MARLNLHDMIADALMLRAGNRFGITQLTLGGTLTMSGPMNNVLAIDPGGAARKVLLHASPKRGDFYILINTADAAEVITVQNSAGVGLTPACTPTQNEVAIIVYVDATLGWRSCVALGA